MVQQARNRQAAKQRAARAGAMLKKIRTDQGKTMIEVQTEVHRLTGTFPHYTRISGIESGNDRLRSEWIGPYAKALGIEPRYLAKLMLSAYDPDMYGLLFDELPDEP